jgi:hypothetical protein
MDFTVYMKQFFATPERWKYVLPCQRSGGRFRGFESFGVVELQRLASL